MRDGTVRILAVATALGALVACTDAADIDDTGSDAPDVSGRYNVQVTGTNGCDDRPELVADWMEGPLTVAGDATALQFDFGDGVVLGGSVDDVYGFEFGGDVDADGAALSITAAGVVYSQDDRWVLEGDLEAVVDDGSTSDCTMEVIFEAYQVAP